MDGRFLQPPHPFGFESAVLDGPLEDFNQPILVPRENSFEGKVIGSVVGPKDGLPGAAQMRHEFFELHQALDGRKG